MENRRAGSVVGDNHARKDFGQLSLQRGTVIPQHTNGGAEKTSEKETGVINQDSEPIVTCQKMHNAVQNHTFDNEVRQQFKVKV